MSESLAYQAMYEAQEFGIDAEGLDQHPHLKELVILIHETGYPVREGEWQEAINRDLADQFEASIP